MTTAIERVEPAHVVSAAQDTLSIPGLVAHVRLIQEALRSVMQPDIHYGIIPGTPKPTLYKAGAEILCLLFRFDPQYAIGKLRDGEHLEIESTCTLYHIPTGHRVGSGMGSCSTRESKYAWRNGGRTCPTCKHDALIRGKEEYGGGWLCFKKKGGCGAKFAAGDKAIEGQVLGRVPNPDLPDQYNTVLKMANKRSLVAAALNATAASDLFTQDIEDLPEFSRAQEPASEPHNPKPATRNGARHDVPDAGRLLTAIDNAVDSAELGDLKDEARSVWKKLTKAQQVSVSAAIEDATARLESVREPGSDG